MSEANKRLLQFTAIFIASAIIVFFIMKTRNPHTISNPPKAADSLITVVGQEIDSLKFLLDNESDNVEILAQIGNRYFDLSQYQPAIEYYEQALFLNPDNPLVLTDCAIMYLRIDSSDKALEYLDRAINLKPDLAQAYFNKGLILMTVKNDTEKALDIWQEYIRLAPESEQAELLRQQIETVEREMK